MGNSGVLGLPRPLVESSMTISYTFWAGDTSSKKQKKKFRDAKEKLDGIDGDELMERLQSRSTIPLDSVEVKDGDRGSKVLLCHLDRDSVRQEDIDVLNKSVQGIIGNYISSSISA
jgi:hypothetical protein